MTLRSSVAIKDQLDNVLAYLIDQKLALVAKTSVLKDGVLTWSQADGVFLAERAHHSMKNYRHWVENACYSAMLFDGALLQVTYVFENEEVVGHRLAYVPCPFELDPHDLEDLEPTFVLDVAAESGFDLISLRTAIRFDYDPIEAKPGHPAVHLTLNESHSRIACAGPVTLHQFLIFVFDEFYLGAGNLSKYFKGFPKMSADFRTITHAEERLPHFNWSS